MMKRKPIPPHLQPLLPQLDQIKAKVDANDYNYVIAKDIHAVIEQLAKLNPFNVYLFDMFAEAEKLNAQSPGPIPSQSKAMLKLKADFWKEKLGDSVAHLIE
jgi:hypothetical protein